MIFYIIIMGIIELSVSWIRVGLQIKTLSYLVFIVLGLSMSSVTHPISVLRVRHLETR